MPDPTTPGYEDVFLAVLSMDTCMRDSNDLERGLSKLVGLKRLNVEESLPNNLASGQVIA
jgi:hypothetical protein